MKTCQRCAKPYELSPDPNFCAWCSVVHLDISHCEFCGSDYWSKAGHICRPEIQRLKQQLAAMTARAEAAERSRDGLRNERDLWQRRYRNLALSHMMGECGEKMRKLIRRAWRYRRLYIGERNKWDAAVEIGARYAADADFLRKELADMTAMVQELQECLYGVTFTVASEEYPTVIRSICELLARPDVKALLPPAGDAG